MKKKILFVAAAHSGGHLVPALVAARRWKDSNHDGQVVLLTSTERLDRLIAKQHPWVDQHVTLACERLHISRSFTCVQLLQVFFSCLFYAWRYKPEKLIITGGIIALPVTLACWAMRSSIDLYELNVMPGKANKILMPFATTVFYCFKQTLKNCSLLGKSFIAKCTLVPYPLRYSQQDRITNKYEFLGHINDLLSQQSYPERFNHQRKTIFILGGSQGSLGLSSCFTHFIKKYAHTLGDSLQVIHQTNQTSTTELKRLYHQHKIPAYVFSYTSSMPQLYQLADLVICRAGAGTLFELEYFQTPALIVPLITRNTNHQRANAYAMANNKPKQFVVLEQKAIEKKPTILSKAIIEKVGFMSTPEKTRGFPLPA
ncbi:MAG: UDP-N-acetylglucosamine--N-acetylmuramyl-(pentapeptide) pyrophosphoryl-undecaprenol N-acetylglucosamine transferase [Epsilonproteobacteria bacterium]|nr:UDP-N-acetylglucosamine--N-acetylmuramyl-(pentapeptide) pyrophosphoryl-undecaprenol N-acetylglucosamine transferase [Campylobacterota bacterium]